MANHVYPELSRAMAKAEVDVEAVTWVFQLLDASYVYDGGDQFAAAFGGAELGGALTLPSPTLVVAPAWVDLTCDDSALTITGLVNLDAVAAAVAYIDTGSPATSTLGAYYDRRADTSPVAFTSTGADQVLTFPFGYFIRL